MKKQLRSKLTISRESLRLLDQVAAGAIVGTTATTCGTIECPSETGGCTAFCTNFTCVNCG